MNFQGLCMDKKNKRQLWIEYLWKIPTTAICNFIDIC